MPLFLITICKCLGTKSFKFLKYSTVISWHHIFFSSSFSAPRFVVFFSDIVVFILCQQFLMRFKSRLLPGHLKNIYLLLFEVSCHLLGLVAGSTIMHKYLRTINVVKVEHVVFQNLQIKQPYSLFYLFLNQIKQIVGVFLS